MEATYTPLYDNAIFHVLCYLDNNIFGSIIYTYKNFIPLNTRTYIGDYCTILYSYIDFFEIDRYVLYKNNYCVELKSESDKKIFEFFSKKLSTRPGSLIYKKPNYILSD